MSTLNVVIIKLLSSTPETNIVYQLYTDKVKYTNNILKIFLKLKIKPEIEFCTDRTHLKYLCLFLEQNCSFFLKRNVVM